MALEPVSSNSFSITQGYFEAITRFECDVAAIAAKVTILAFPIIVLVTLFLDFIGCGKETQPQPQPQSDQPYYDHPIGPELPPVKNSEVDNSPLAGLAQLKPSTRAIPEAPKPKTFTVEFGTNKQVPKAVNMDKEAQAFAKANKAAMDAYFTPLGRQAANYTAKDVLAYLAVNEPQKFALVQDKEMRSVLAAKQK